MDGNMTYVFRVFFFVASPSWQRWRDYIGGTLRVREKSPGFSSLGAPFLNGWFPPPPGGPGKGMQRGNPLRYMELVENRYVWVLCNVGGSWVSLSPPVGG